MSVRTPDPDPEDSERDFGPVDRPAGNNPAWLSDLELAEARGRLPMLYVEAVPVRTDGLGQVTEVGMLLRSTLLGEITRTIVSGRVRMGETVRDALFRHIENDLGPMSFPLLPVQPAPFMVAEYFPTPGQSPFHDDRQHAVSLVFVVPVTGTCEPRQDALEVTWFTPQEAASDAVTGEMEGGRGAIIRSALANLGLLT
jgi:hypothetical protein